MAVRKLKFPLIVNKGIGVTVSNNGIPFDGVTFLVQQVSIGQEVATNSNVQFNAVSASNSILAGSTTFEDTGVTGDFTVDGTLTVSSNLTVPGNATVGGTVTAEELLAEYNTSVAIFKSGSTQFGDSVDDEHIMVGSVYQSGSVSLNEYTINEFSNDDLLADSSSISLPTENALKTYVDTQGLYVDRQEYVRKNFSSKADSITNNTASFSAFSASAPTEMTSTSEGDFIFFNNGQAMEHDAIAIQQVENSFLLKVDASSIGYNLESADEILSWGKFEAPGYLKFDGVNDVVTTTFSSSGAPVDTT